MLLISRKEAQAIKIGRDITIRVIELGSGRVKLGIEAPKSMRVSRIDEIVDDMLEKNKEKNKK